MIGQILALLVKTLTEDEKYSVVNRENLTQPIQMQLSKKQKTFSEFFPKFSKSRLNFEHCQTNNCQMIIICNNRDGKRSKPLLKSEGQLCYHIY